MVATRSYLRPLRLPMVLAILAGLLVPATVLADAHEAVPIDQPAEFAAVRDRFEGLSPAEVEAAGYVADPPECVSSPLGGMGVHAVNGALLADQFPAGTMDAENPPIVLLNASMTEVIGLEWEAADVGQGEMMLFGQPVVLQPGHPGAEEDHYMLHAYFRPNGQVLFAPFDPEVTCPMPDVAMEQPNPWPNPLTIVGAALVATGALVTWGRRRGTL